MSRIRKIFAGKERTLGPRARAAVLVTVLAACGGDAPGAPEAPDPTPAAPETSDRVLPEGTFELSLSACERCGPGSVPNYLLAFADGVRARITIMAATETTASVELVEMRRLGESAGGLLGLFAEPVVRLAWDGPEGVFRGFVEYGTAALFVARMRRAGDELECGFDLIHLKHDVGPTTCRVVQ
ncbi:MAG: hypothetical protein ACODAA_07030 [Gemmatimonadota bacterium]